MLFKTLLLVSAATLSLAVPPKYVWPCVLSDLHCIRDNLRANSYCNPWVRGSIPAQYTIGAFRFETPYFNASYIERNLVVRNHNKCVVSEFFFNTEEDSAVIALDCRNFDLESDRELLQHHSLKEDSIYNYHIRGIYPLIRVTMNVRHASNFNICNAFTFADVTALPTFHIDPKATVDLKCKARYPCEISCAGSELDKDKQTANFLTRDLTHLNIFEREYFAYRANLILRYFVNALICDFGCDF